VEAIDAVFITHEHSDHSAGVVALALRHEVPVYCTAGTASACCFDEHAVPWRRVDPGQVIGIGALHLEAYVVPHDAGEPVQYTFSDGARRAAVLTDAGECSASILSALVGLHALVLECNHDARMLQQGAYPAFLKQRIAGARGHLSNEQAAGILHQIDRRELVWVAAAHLSAANNRPDLAQCALAGVLGCDVDDVPGRGPVQRPRLARCLSSGDEKGPALPALFFSAERLTSWRLLGLFNGRAGFRLGRVLSTSCGGCAGLADRGGASSGSRTSGGSRGRHGSIGRLGRVSRRSGGRGRAGAGAAAGAGAGAGAGASAFLPHAASATTIMGAMRNDLFMCNLPEEKSEFLFKR